MRPFQPAMDSASIEVDLTPLLDVVFIMLVFFVVTATFLKETGLSVYLPATGGDVPPEVETVAVRVEAAGVFVVNQRVVSDAGLAPYLQYLFSGNPDANFAVLVSRYAQVDDTVTAIDAGRQLGFDVVPIATLD